MRTVFEILGRIEESASKRTAGSACAEEEIMRMVRELMEASMEVSRDAVEKKCDEVTDALERATRAYGDIADSVTRGIEGVDIGRGEQKDLLRSMRLEVAAIFKAHDRIAAIKKAMRKGSIAMVPKGDPL